MSLPSTTASTPKGRIKRSVVQSLVGLVPATLALLNSDHLSAVKASKYGGTSVAGVLLIAIIQNVAESKGWITPK